MLSAEAVSVCVIIIMSCGDRELIFKFRFDLLFNFFFAYMEYQWGPICSVLYCGGSSKTTTS